jgi:urea transporter
MFQGSAWSGLLILVGIFLGCHLDAPAGENMPAVAWGALVALIVSTATGYIFESPSDGDQGLWGFNGILVGCAVFTFLGVSPLSWALLIIASALTVPLRRGLNRLFAPLHTTSYTFPFIVVTWVILLAARNMACLAPVGESTPAFPVDAEAVPVCCYTLQELTVYWLRGISQVFLVNSWVTGAFFIIALAVCNRWAAFWAMLSAAVALYVSLSFGAPRADIAGGLYGFSAVLTGIAVGCTFYKPSVKSFLYALTAVLSTVFVQCAMDAFFAPTGLATLTAPFCVTTWLFMFPMYKLKKE